MSVKETKRVLNPLQNCVSHVVRIRIMLWDNNKRGIQYRSARVYCNGEFLFALPLVPARQGDIVQEVVALLNSSFESPVTDWQDANCASNKCCGFLYTVESTGTKEECRVFGRNDFVTNKGENYGNS